MVQKEVIDDYGSIYYNREVKILTDSITQTPVPNSKELKEFTSQIFPIDNLWQSFIDSYELYKQGFSDGKK